ncbi:M1-specific T cell receptor beta chain-like isoform X4 [Genypterus blacodes]|uniref:M1-specific T cell receptor beta chain-like isoform X4 n=1 Tax=Genypterus blacodes TaxID=154954 RepID=UPI003F75881F
MDAIKHGLLSLLVFLLWIKGLVDGSDVIQTPILWKNKGGNATMDCRHTKGVDYNQMYWYRQLPGEGMRQIVFTRLGIKDHNFEPDFTMETFSATKPDADSGTFTVKNLVPEDEGLYFCAVTCALCQYEAYFGQGTKLMVLEPGHDVTPPTVQVFKPSEKECKVKTLVCVASGFYPDHVSVSWEVDGVTETDSVATDNTALREGKHYSLSSRLTVQSKTWFKPSRTFTCRVSFFNGTDTIDVQDSITGETDSGGMPNDTKMKIMQNAKLTYSVLIAKSFIYGVFIMFLVWKLKGLSGKQSSRERSCGLNN